MRQAGLLHKHRKPNDITIANIETQEKENLIKRDFSADKPLKKLLTDITQVQCWNDKLYVLPILDCFNGEIVALEMWDNMKKGLCVTAVKQLKEHFGQLEGTILHRDRGCQYTNYAFRQQLSSTERCYDNARMESFLPRSRKRNCIRYRLTE